MLETDKVSHCTGVHFINLFGTHRERKSLLECREMFFNNNLIPEE